MEFMKHPDRYFMLKAIEEGKRAVLEGNYAVGSLMVVKNEIVSIQHTSIHTLKDPTAHGEILAIRESSRKLNSIYIPDGYLYTTLEPCPMCTAAAVWAKIKGIIYGASTEDAKQIFLKRGMGLYDWRQIDISAKYVIESGKPKIELYPGFMREECLKLLMLNK
jgi:tRNA(Arg) A34 adenosine deaminase TadA